MPPLCSLPSGAEYCAPAISPKQRIRRRQTPKWTGDSALSKFQVAVDDTQLWRKQRPAAFGYWSPFDLLGLFLSKMGPAPNFGTATDVNFYLPLTAVYARFCMWIGHNKRPALMGDKPEDSRGTEGVGDPPSYWQCTWEPKSGQFFLGATLSGYMWPSNETGRWKAVLRRKRWSLFSGFHNFPGDYKDWANSATKVHDGRDTRFGNCAETYPFLEMLGGHYNLENRGKMRGLALHRDFAKVPEYKAAEIALFRDRPCLHCRKLLTWAGISDSSFRRPPRPRRP